MWKISANQSKTLPSNLVMDKHVQINVHIVGPKLKIPLHPFFSSLRKEKAKSLLEQQMHMSIYMYKAKLVNSEVFSKVTLIKMKMIKHGFKFGPILEREIGSLAPELL
mgnify:FL=1